MPNFIAFSGALIRASGRSLNLGAKDIAAATQQPMALSIEVNGF
jgi:hypothetical protein